MWVMLALVGCAAMGAVAAWKFPYSELPLMATFFSVTSLMALALTAPVFRISARG